jgi:hypothetical protein
VTRPRKAPLPSSRRRVIPSRQASFDAGMPLRRVADALARGSIAQLIASVRSYTSRSRAHGDSVEIIVKRLMDVVDTATSDQTILAKRACEVAGCAIDAYFEDSASPRGWRHSSGDRWSRDASGSSGC